MPKQWLTQKRVMVAIVLGLGVCSLLPAGTVTAIARLPQGLLSAATRPPLWVMQTLGSDLDPGETEPVIDRASRQRLQQELGRALRYNRELEAALQRKEQQIAQLQQTQAKTEMTVSMVAARVLSVSGSKVNPALTIDRGRRSGVRQGQAVVFAGSLVGQIDIAGPVTATVRLLTAAGNTLQVRLAPPVAEAARHFETRAELTESRDAFFADPSKQKTVKKGDLAHLRDSGWPPAAQGAIVGKVQRIIDHPKKPLLMNRVFIEPLPPLKQLDRVTVLVPQRESPSSE